MRCLVFFSARSEVLSLSILLQRGLTRLHVCVPPFPGPWRDCQHVLDSGENTSGIYLLRPQGTNRLLQAWCEQSHAQGGWTVIQKRQDGSVNFFRTWEQYKVTAYMPEKKPTKHTSCTSILQKIREIKHVGQSQLGFGNLDGEYWLGLEHLYWMTKQAQYKLRVMLEDWHGRQVFAEYDSFSLEPESDWYRLRLGQYSGNAGDSLSWHNNKAFTTLDRDKDSYTGLSSPPCCCRSVGSRALAVNCSQFVSR